MSLPNSYTVKYNAIPDYLNAILEAHPPERFSYKFLENLGFTSTNDRMFIGIMKELGFIDDNAVPQQRYYDYLDRSNSATVLADAIREAYSDLFAINKNAQDLNVEDVKNKLRTLYAGKKTDLVIGRIAKTFEALVAEADFSKPAASAAATERKGETTQETPPKQASSSSKREPSGRLDLQSLQCHINIVSRKVAIKLSMMRSSKV